MAKKVTRRNNSFDLVLATSMLALLVACGASDTSTVSPTSDVEQTVNTDVATTTTAASRATSTTTTTSISLATSTSLPAKSASDATFAIDVFEQIAQANEFSGGYSRDLFRHWIDADRDGCSTREEVLIAESITNAQVDRFGCAVIAGDWFSEFDGLDHTDPSNLDIDHLVPLKEAWDSGAHAWSSTQREQFANDLSDGRALIAVTNSVNRSKGDRDPSQWLPPRSEYVCQYIADWVAVKQAWNLTMDPSEWGRVKNLLNGPCEGIGIRPWGQVK